MIFYFLATPTMFSPTYDQIRFFDFPRTVQQRLRLTVFRDLWRKGYYLTPGLKFGCDFLVYPGMEHFLFMHYSISFYVLLEKCSIYGVKMI